MFVELDKMCIVGGWEITAVPTVGGLKLQLLLLIDHCMSTCERELEEFQGHRSRKEKEPAEESKTGEKKQESTVS